MIGETMTKKRLRKIFRHKHKYINGTKGVISLFLAILMLPFTSIAGTLINAARIDSAVAIFDEALSNASNSTLGTYDSFLRKRFGLLAMSQDVSGKADGLDQYTVSDLISETFQFYLEQNLNTLSNTYISSESVSKGIYSLSDPDVLLTQVLEFSKYSVPVKLIEDSLPLDDMMKSLKNALPGNGFFDLITSGAGVADSMVTLGEDFTLLSDAVKEGKTSITNYDNAYIAFAEAVSDYVSKKQEMQTRLANLQADIDNENVKATNLSQQIDNLNKEISDLEAEQERTHTDKSKEIKEKNESLTKAGKDYEDAVKDRDNAQDEYNKTKSSYEFQLSSLQAKVSECKSTYSSKISELSGKLTNVQSKLTTVQGDIINLGNSVGNMAITGYDTYIANQKSKIDENIDDLKKQAENADDNGKKELEKQIQELKDSKVKLDNQKEVGKAQEKGFSSAMNTMKQSIAEFNVNIYSQLVEELRTLKSKVDAYDASNIEGNISKTEYYVSISGLLTEEAVSKAENDFVSETVKTSVWATLKAMASFLQALFKISLVFDPELGAVIDTNYYKKTYGGLPSEKDRTVYPLSEGEDGDKELSEYYKSLFGDYSSADASILGGFDIIEALKQIFTDLQTITSTAEDMQNLKKILDFAKNFKKMIDAAGRIVNNIKGILSYLANALAESTVISKALLSGYVSYMTSNRTTYGGKALTNTSFNERAQTPTVAGEVPRIGSMLSLISTIQGLYSGGTDKCFVGAETEYIIFGSTAELANQAAAFGVIYLIRVVSNLFAIFTNAEVASIAGASTIAAPLVYLIYILVEPLVDTVLLVNGSNVPLIKTMVYLTPTGINALITKFSNIKLTNAELDTQKKALTNAWEASGYTDVMEAFGTSMDTSDKSIFEINYSKILLIIMSIFTPRDKMLGRLSNIIEMEAVEYVNNKVVGSNKLFDLDYSYTYIRTEASFTTNEFLPISDVSGLNSKKRIVYRGY